MALFCYQVEFAQNRIAHFYWSDFGNKPA